MNEETTVLAPAHIRQYRWRRFLDWLVLGSPDVHRVGSPVVPSSVEGYPVCLNPRGAATRGSPPTRWAGAGRMPLGSRFRLPRRSANVVNINFPAAGERVERCLTRTSSSPA